MRRAPLIGATLAVAATLAVLAVSAAAATKTTTCKTGSDYPYLKFSKVRATGATCAVAKKLEKAWFKTGTKHTCAAEVNKSGTRTCTLLRYECTTKHKARRPRYDTVCLRGSRRVTWLFSP